jgi:serine/threonine-protein kinase ULK4
MAPELFQEQGVYSYFTDFWALGCMLYEMSLGKPIFTGSNLKDLLA